MKNSDINIRDPFVLVENGKYYMYGTRGKNFGREVGGFDVYVSDDLENWSEPIECFNSVENGMNTCVNWAPEVHKYNGSYYLFATFTRENGLRVPSLSKPIHRSDRSGFTAAALSHLMNGNALTELFLLKTAFRILFSAMSIRRLLTAQCVI